MHPAAAAAGEKPIVKTPVDFFGQELFARRMGGKKRERLEKALRPERSGDTFLVRAVWTVFTLCDAEGAYVYEENQLEEVGELDWLELDKVFKAGRNVNGASDEALKEIEKNS